MTLSSERLRMELDIEQESKALTEKFQGAGEDS